jgi:hypothetical protein
MNKPTKRKVYGGMTVRSYDVLRRAVEDGVAYGYRRAHKYSDKPEPEAVKEAIEQAVMSEICEWFDFGGEEPPPVALP